MNPRPLCSECGYGVMQLSDDGENSVCDRCGASMVEPLKDVGLAGIEKAREAWEKAAKPGRE